MVKIALSKVDNIIFSNKKKPKQMPGLSEGSDLLRLLLS